MGTEEIAFLGWNKGGRYHSFGLKVFLKEQKRDLWVDEPFGYDPDLEIPVH